MKTKIFILAALIFSLILFTVSCIADDPADESNNVSRSESMPQEESVNESTPPEESKPAEESKPEESIPPEESKPEESEPTQPSISELLSGYPIIKSEETLAEDYLTFAMAFQKTNENTLGKLITVESSMSSSNGKTRSSFTKELSVGTPDDFTVVLYATWEASHQSVEEYHAYLYFDKTERTLRENKYYSGGWHDQTYQNIFEQEASYIADNDIFDIWPIFGSDPEDAYNIISKAINRIRELEFTHNSDGTISASGWLVELEERNEPTVKITVTYDPDTGYITEYIIDQDIEGDLWYHFDSKAVITDADESTVPTKEDALAGNW